MPQLEVDHRVRGGQRIREQALETLELLLSPDDRTLLLLELVEQLEAFLLEGPELAFHPRTVPIQLQKLVRCGVLVPLYQRSKHRRDSVKPGRRNIAPGPGANRDSEQGYIAGAAKG